MRRPVVIVAILAAVAVIVVIRAGAGAGSGYKVAAIFDDAKGMVPGQQVKIAGAVVGSVQHVQLTSLLKARIVMSIKREFAPFRADASCSILPEGLISENYIECDPGRASAPLPVGPGGTPVVPLSATSVPFSLQDVLNILSMPTDEQLQVLISQLGIATAGRGEDLNGLLLRADPALTQSRRVLAIIDSQRQQLSVAVGQTDQVLAQLAGRDAQVREFVDRAAAVVNTTADHRVALGETVNRLPAMLAALRPGLRSLRRATANATPLLAELRSSAPGLDELTNVLPSFTRAGIPALRTLGARTAHGVPVVRAAVPLVGDLLHASGPVKTLANGLDQLLVSTRNAGGLEGLLRLTYSFAVESSMYDNVSHIATFLANVEPSCIAGDAAGVNVTGCSHNFRAPGEGEIPVNEPSCGQQSGAWLNDFCAVPAPGPIALVRRRHAATRSGQRTQHATTTPAAGAAAPAPAARKPIALPHLPVALPSGVATTVQQVSSLLKYLLK